MFNVVRIIVKFGVEIRLNGDLDQCGPDIVQSICGLEWHLLKLFSVTMLPRFLMNLVRFIRGA